MRRFRPARRPDRVARTLSDPALDRRLAEDGFVVLRLLDAEAAGEVGASLALYGAAPGDERTGLFNDSWATDRAYTRARSEELGRVFRPAVAQAFVGHRALIWGTSVKWPGNAGVVVAHRDPTFVDERRFRSVGIFCAVHGLNLATGTLEVLPGSHRSSRDVRVHQSQRNLIEELSPDVERRFVAIPMTPGEAIVYDHSLVHRSGPNRGDRPRIAVMTHLVPDRADVRYAVPVGGDVARLLAVDEEFFLSQQVNRLDVPTVVRAHRTVATVPDPPGSGSL